MANKYGVSVKNLVIDGRKASAVVEITDILGDVQVCEVHTNIEGQGIWVNGKQQLGTCQFGVKPTRGSAYNAFRRYFMD